MSSSNPFLTMTQLRVALTAGTWNQIDLPVGARDALIQVDSATAIWRLSTDSGLSTSGEGSQVTATNGIRLNGTAARVTTFFVNPDINTTAQVLYQI